MVNRHGLLPAVHKRIESRSGEDVKPVLKELGMEDYSFEEVAKAYPEDFQRAAA